MIARNSSSEGPANLRCPQRTASNANVCRWMRSHLWLMLFIAALSLVAMAQPDDAPLATPIVPETAKTLADRLGYDRDTKLLIIHADDLGVTHSENAASISALEKGMVNSGSIMVNCPWFTEIAEYAQSHPEADLGLHITLTSEWPSYKWGPVAPKEQVPSLVDPNGYLYPDARTAATHMDPKEVELEIRAQIERALAFGIRPTHLDAHMGTLFTSGPLFEALLSVGRDYGIPVMVTKEWLKAQAFMAAALRPNDIVIDRMLTISPDVPSSEWQEFYEQAIQNLQPGVTEFLIHTAYDDDEMRAVTTDRPEWGSAWRQRDFDFFTSRECKRLLHKNHIKLVTWSQISRVLTSGTARKTFGQQL